MLNAFHVPRGEDCTVGREKMWKYVIFPSNSRISGLCVREDGGVDTEPTFQRAHTDIPRQT